jgi:photosystem II stability/assembly factor-like uncharacterized protein
MKCHSFSGTIHDVLMAFLVIGATSAHHRAYSQWIQQNSGTSATLNAVCTLQPATAITAGDSGIILRTTNSGTTWARTNVGGSAWNAMAFRTAQRGIVVGQQGSIAKTTDGGITWAYWNTGSARNYTAVSFGGASELFVGDDSGGIMLSHNNGDTWELLQFPLHGTIQDICMELASEFPFGGYAIMDRVVYQTTDGGSTWVQQPLPITSWGSALKGEIAPGGTTFVVGFDGQVVVQPLILRKTALDTIWHTFIFMPPSPAVILRGVSAPSQQVAYACGTGGAIFKTIDGGGFWSIGFGPTTGTLNAIQFYNDLIGFAVGDSGTILFTASGGATSVDDAGSIPGGYSLSQNYPNPFNATTVMSYELGVKSEVRLVVYDVLGREVERLVDEVAQPGRNTATWDAGTNASGVYFCRMEAGGRIVQTRKLVVLR